MVRNNKRVYVAYTSNRVSQKDLLDKSFNWNKWA